jgi:hypothetical protein
VLVVGLGLALTVLGGYITSLGSPAAQFGWFGYAPLTNQFRPEDSDLAPWAQFLVWLALIAVWTGASAWLLKHRN